MGPRTDPCGTPHRISIRVDVWSAYGGQPVMMMRLSLMCVWCTGEAVNHTPSRQLGCVCGVQVKLSIIHLVGSGGVSAERAACLLITAAADSRHR